MSKLNQEILEKIGETDEEEWVKKLAKRLLNYERNNITKSGRGGYKDSYEEFALRLFEED